MHRIILSSGLGPLHFVSAATHISKEVKSLRFVCGYVPKYNNSILLRLVAKLRGKSILAGIKKRKINAQNVDIASCVSAEFINQVFLVIGRMRAGLYSSFESFAWSYFGWQSRKYIYGADVFHVRSGAGQGGAIAYARKHHLKVLVDHSALHPATSEENLRDECTRWEQKPPIDPTRGVWQNVLKDCKEADMIVVNANHIKDSFVRHGFDASKIRVVHLGVREDFWGLKVRYEPSGTFHVLFTGGFVILKGAEYILKSLQMLVSLRINVHYDIVGAVGVPDAMLEVYKGLPITYHGQVPQDDLKDYLAKSDCYLFPSLADGCAQSGMEALAAGLPVVATYQSGLPISDGETGCLVEMKNAKAIAETILWLIKNRGAAERIGRNAAKMMREHYTWKMYAEHMCAVYDELLSTCCSCGAELPGNHYD